MATIAEIQTALVDWVTAQLPSRIVKVSSAGEGPQFRTPYCVILVREDEKIGHQTARLSEDGLTETITNLVNLEVSINFYFGETKQDAAILRASLASSQRFTDLWTVIGFVNDGVIEDLTELETGAMRQRAKFTILFSANIGWAFASDSFDKAEITLEREDVLPTFQIDVDGNEVPPVC